MEITEEFKPGCLGSLIATHGEHYARHWGFGPFFEAKVAREAAGFAARKTDTDLALFALDEAGFCASLILDLHDPDSGSRGAHLRWFITTDRCRGTGIGRALMARAMAHADAHAGGKAWLTTFAGLAPARHLYESHGFTLVHEAPGTAWGTEVREQEFRR